MIKFLHAVFYSLSIFRSIITIIRFLIWLIWPILYIWRDRLTLHLKIPFLQSRFLGGMQVERHWPFKNDFLGTKRSQLNTFYIRPSVLAYVRNASKLAEHLSLLLSPRSTCLMSLGDFWRPPHIRHQFACVIMMTRNHALERKIMKTWRHGRIEMKDNEKFKCILIKKNNQNHVTPCETNLFEYEYSKNFLSI